MVQLGRDVPDLPGDLLFSDSELRVLATFARSRTLPAPTRLGDAVGLVARLGGWLGRKRDPPGAQLLVARLHPTRRHGLRFRTAG